MQPLAMALPGIAPARPDNKTHRFRQVDRAAQWRQELERRFGELMVLAKTPEQRQQIEKLHREAVERGPDFARVRRNARFVTPPACKLDRNQAARLIWQAERIARGFWQADHKHARGSGQRIKRTLSRTALEVFRAIVRMACRYAVVFPSLEGLAYQAGLSRRTVVRTLKELESVGLVAITRRCKRVQTPAGVRVVQDTSVYRPLVSGFAAMATRIFDAASECQSGPASSPKTSASNEEVRVAGRTRNTLDLIPLPDHAPTPKAGRIPWWAMIRR